MKIALAAKGTRMQPAMGLLLYLCGFVSHRIQRHRQAVMAAAMTACCLSINAADLEVGKPLESRLAGGQSQEFRLTLHEGQYAHVKLEPKDIRSILSVLGPDGETAFDAGVAQSGSNLSAELVAGKSGVYRVVVAAAEESAPLGTFQISLPELQTATQRHRARAAGSRTFAKATRVWAKRSRPSITEAIGLFEAAVSHWREAEDRVYEACTLYSMANAYAEIGESEKALRAATEALAPARASGNAATEAWVLYTIGSIHNNFGDRRKAADHFTQALPLMRAANDRLGEASVLNNLGVAYAQMGEIHKGLDYFGQAAAVLTPLQDRSKLATLNSNMGLNHGTLGDYGKALEYYDRALKLHEASGNRVGVAITLNNIGSAYSSMADYQKGLDSYRAALDIARALGRDWDIATKLHNIAWVHATLGDRVRAVTVYQEALAILRKVKDWPSTANTLNNLGETVAELGNDKKALEYFAEALALRKSVGDRPGEATSLTNQGKIFAKLGQHDKARANYEEATAILRKCGNQRKLAAVLLHAGALSRQTREYASAAKSLGESLAISREIQDRRSEADSLVELARLERDRGDYVAAHHRAGEALSVLEALRLTVISPNLRAWFFAMFRDLQEMEIGLLMRLHRLQPNKGFAVEALLASERSKARSLLELLGESSLEIRQGVDEKLLARERELVRLLFVKAEQHTKLLNLKSPAAAALGKEVTVLTADLEHVQSRIRETSPQYAALTRPEPLGLGEIQQSVLDRETVLLEFSLGAEKSFLWIVSASSVESFELPGRTAIEAAVRRVHAHLTARSRYPSGETPELRSTRISQSDAAYFSAAAEASRMLLGQAAKAIRNKRLLIVADGALQYLPFGALPEPVADQGPNPPPLIVNHEIIWAPSASVLSALRKELPGRKPADKMLAVVADPVFSANDARVKVRPAVFGPEGNDFARLRFSRTEAEEIARLAPTDSTLKALDFDANRDTVLNSDLGRFRIVHFATHSFLNHNHPELSGVVLSHVDTAGRPRNGLLRLYDIYNMRLRSELVVLSACETALGGEIKGEGLIGLTRGFLYAGAPRVVATLWRIDDRTTAEMMRRFYEALLVRGERPAAALRSAQVSMWKTKGWDAPYRWAAFTLQGEWR